MTCTQALLSLLLITPCTDGGSTAMNVAVAEALASPQRTEADRSRDPLRKPDRVLEFFEIKPGMRVLDLFAGGGYYSEILSRVVGPLGEVVSHNNQAYLDFVQDEVAARFADDRLPNVQRLAVEANDFQLQENHFDATLAILTWHDFYYGDESINWPDVDESKLVNTLCKAMKPGAVLGIIDHVASAGADARTAGHELHRVDPQRIRDDLANSCFMLEDEASFLRNPQDPLDIVAMDPSVRGKTDRVIYKYRRKT